MTGMTSAKSYDFLSELKATLSKLTTRTEDDVEDVAETATEQTPKSTISQDVHHHHQQEQQATYHQDNHLASTDAETTGACRRSVLYGELSSVLEKRGQQQQQHPSDASRVIELESRLKPGKSIIYLGSGGQRRDSVAMVTQRTTVSEPQLPGSDVVMTSPADDDNVGLTSALTGSDVEVAGCSDEDEHNNTTDDATSTSSAVVSMTHVDVCPSSNHGTQDSACIMSTDESVESSDCSVLAAAHHHHHHHHHHHDQQQQADTFGKYVHRF